MGKQVKFDKRAKLRISGTVILVIAILLIALIAVLFISCSAWMTAQEEAIAEWLATPHPDNEHRGAWLYDWFCVGMIFGAVAAVAGIVYFVYTRFKIKKLVTEAKSESEQSDNKSDYGETT